MTFGSDWGWGADKRESRRQFDLYVEAGGNFIDTANIYTNGSSEQLVGEFVKGERDRYVIATKYTLSTRPGDPNASGNHRKNMVQAVEASLKRLKTDYIDLYWVHAWDERTPVAETMRALDDLVRSGKVLYVGVSDMPAWVAARANTIAELRGWTPFVGLQIEYSLVERTPERALLPMARGLELAVLAWSPLGSGVLTGKFLGGGADEDTRLKEGSRRLSTRNQEIARTVVSVAEELGCSPAQVAIRWIMQQPGIQIPILGARTRDQLEDNLGALDVYLEDEHLNRLDEASRVELGFPHDFLSLPPIQERVHSGTYDDVDVHRNHV